jgi:hypothetical protein
MKSKLSIALLVVAMLIQGALCFGGETLVIATQDLTGGTQKRSGSYSNNAGALFNGESALKTLDAVAGDTEA